MDLRTQLKERDKMITSMMRGEGMMTQEGYVLTKGRAFTSSSQLTEEQYDYLMCLTDAIACAPKQCFYNAQMITLADSYRETPRVKYYEGYVFTGFMPILHAWITLDDKIVDVTLSTDPESGLKFAQGQPPQEDLRDRVLGVIPDGWEYLGVPMDTDYVTSTLLRHTASLSLIDNWQDGWPLLKTA